MALNYPHFWQGGELAKGEEKEKRKRERKIRQGEEKKEESDGEKGERDEERQRKGYPWCCQSEKRCWLGSMEGPYE